MNLETPQQADDTYHGHSPQELEYFRDHAHLPISLEGLKDLCAGNQELESLYRSMMDYCMRYTEDVLKMEKLEKTPTENRDEHWKSEFQKMDKARTILHNATMDSINILSRNLRSHDKSNEWLRPLATGGRSAYGRFAIGLSFSYYLALRERKSHEQ